MTIEVSPERLATCGRTCLSVPAELLAEAGPVAVNHICRPIA